MDRRNKQALNAVAILKDYCHSHECPGCQFYHPGNGCILTGETSPMQWNTQGLSRWTEGDVALAEALTLAGVRLIQRDKWKGHLILFSNNGLDVLQDTSKVLQAFKGLKRGEQIFLSEIIRGWSEKLIKM